MTIFKCIEVLDGFSAIGNQVLPVSTSYKVATQIQKLKVITEPFFQSRQGLIEALNKKYNGEVPEEASEKFKSDVKDLLEQEVEVDLDVIDLSGCEIEVNAKILTMCMPFITVSTDESEENR